jgi:hypothetical protein
MNFFPRGHFPAQSFIRVNLLLGVVRTEDAIPRHSPEITVALELLPQT